MIKSFEPLRTARIGTPFSFTTDAGTMNLVFIEAVEPQSSINVPFLPYLEIFAMKVDGVPVSILVSNEESGDCVVTNLPVH